MNLLSKTGPELYFGTQNTIAVYKDLRKSLQRNVAGEVVRGHAAATGQLVKGSRDVVVMAAVLLLLSPLPSLLHLPGASVLYPDKGLLFTAEDPDRKWFIEPPVLLKVLKSSKIWMTNSICEAISLKLLSFSKRLQRTHQRRFSGLFWRFSVT